MGVDYDGVGGIGVAVEDYLDQIISSGAFTQEEWDDSNDSCLDKKEMGFLYTIAGDAYSGRYNYYLLVEGNNLEEVNKNAPAFIEKFREQFNIVLTFKDLKVIEDLGIW